LSGFLGGGYGQGLESKTADESLRFAVFHTADMLIKLEKEYDARWHGEVRG
jgi:hypothetical protein